MPIFFNYIIFFAKLTDLFPAIWSFLCITLFLTEQFFLIFQILLFFSPHIPFSDSDFLPHIKKTSGFPQFPMKTKGLSTSRPACPGFFTHRSLSDISPEHPARTEDARIRSPSASPCSSGCWKAVSPSPDTCCCPPASHALSHRPD